MENNTQTQVEQVEIDPTDIFTSAATADSIITSDKPASKGGFMNRSNTDDFDFVNPKSEEDEEVDENGKPIGTVPAVAVPKKKEGESIIDPLNADLFEDEESKASGPGRPKTEKSGLVDLFKDLIESDEMFVFDDFDDTKETIEEYLGKQSLKDLKELYQANVQSKLDEVKTNTPKEFFDSLPEELQAAARYHMAGGKDMKMIFKALGEVQETRELDPTVEGDQEAIIRTYLEVTNFGDSAEIEEEITTWKDLNVLERKANQFKPKLDKMQEEQLERQIDAQTLRQQQQQEAQEKFINSVYETLKPGELNGIKLKKEVQQGLYNGLVNPNYKSISGKGTNELGHLLEKYQFVEPDYSKIAEALWLLKDREGFIESIKQVGSNATTEKHIRKLKEEQSRKIGGNHNDDDAHASRKVVQKIAKPTGNFFKR